MVIDPTTPGKERAYAWFLGLEDIELEKALAMLPDTDVISIRCGTMADKMPRNEIVALLTQNRKFDRTPMYRAHGNHQLVTIDIHGFAFPIHVRSDKELVGHG